MLMMPLGASQAAETAQQQVCLVLMWLCRDIVEGVSPPPPPGIYRI